LKIGVAGIGMIARQMHLPNLAACPDAEVVALWSRHAESLEHGAAALGGARPTLYQNYATFLAHPELDAVLISAPDSLHEAMFLEALAAGKHIYIEKPPAITEEGNCRILAAAGNADRVLMVGLQNRYAALYTHAADLLAAGSIGRLRMLWCKEYRVPFLPKPGDWILTQAGTGGSLLVKCIHFFDLFNWYAGGRATRVIGSGGGGIVPGQETLDHAWIIVEYPNDVRACLGMVLFAPSGERVDVELIGERGRIALDVAAQTLTLETSAGSETRHLTSAGEHFHPGSHAAIADFLHHCRTGGMPRATIQIGVEAALLALAAEQSIAQARPVMMEATRIA